MIGIMNVPKMRCVEIIADMVCRIVQWDSMGIDNTDQSVADYLIDTYTDGELLCAVFLAGKITMEHTIRYDDHPLFRLMQNKPSVIQWGYNLRDEGKSSEEIRHAIIESFEIGEKVKSGIPVDDGKASLDFIHVTDYTITKENPE